ncbi:TPA: hypothetical protein HA246_04875 [Candidatus Woesearchaeota archaeon]|nr:hypothetical protein [Candidatus Woesearchaeota archaeon]
MRKIKIVFISCILLTIFILSFSTAYSQPFPEQFQEQSQVLWQSLVQFQCQTQPCIEGMPILWQITIGNANNGSFSVNGIVIKTAEGISMANAANLNEQVVSSKTKSFQLESIVPAPTKASTLYYNVCFSIEGQESCEAQPRSMIVWPIANVECISNEACEQDEKCFNFKCKELDCDGIYNHTCVKGTGLSNVFSKAKTSLSVTNVLLLIIAGLLVVIIVLFYIKSKKH